MSKIKVVYATMTKHSRFLAEAIGAALDCEVLDIAGSPEILETELLFIVGGIYGGWSKPELMDFTEGLQKSEVRKAALVTSCASKKRGQDSIRAILYQKKIPVAGEFICRGRFLLRGIGHPNRKDADSAVEFAKEIVRKQKN